MSDLMNVTAEQESIADPEPVEEPRCFLNVAEIHESLSQSKLKLSGVSGEMLKASGAIGVQWMTEL